MYKRVLMGLVGAVLILVGVAGGSGRLAAAQEMDKYAEVAVAYQWGEGVEPEPPWRLKQKAVGEPDAQGQNGYVSLGHAENALQEIDPQRAYDPTEDCEGFLILQWQTVSIVHDFDKDKPDFTVYEVGTNAGVSGVPERMFVFAGTEETADPNDEIDWYYVGEFGAAVDGKVVTGFEVEPGRAFNYVALCDKADGTPPSLGTAGPDIDAVAAHSWEASGQSAVQGESNGDGNELNGVALPDGKKVVLNTLDKLLVDGEIEFNEACLNKVARLVNILNAGKGRRIGATGYEEKPINMVLVVVIRRACAVPKMQMDAPPALELAIEDGDAGFRVLDRELALTVRLDTAVISTVGRTAYKINHDAAAGETWITAEDGPLTIMPANSLLGPYELPEGYTAVFTEDTVSPPFAQGIVFVPLVSGNQ